MTGMPTPTGLSRVRPDGDAIAITRRFAAPVEEVWAAISESELTARWFGTFEGDPADGYVNLVLEVEPTTAGSSLTLSHLVTDPSSIENVGPGWEYYLDRLAAALGGTDPDHVDWEDYYPAMQPYYLALRETMAAR